MNTVKLTDRFDRLHQKDLKNKDGKVVFRADYITWSQVADRLDAAAPGWSFSIVQTGDDWCLGRLTFDGRTFENIGYAENADASWKKEAMKDAVSDSFKRCAALAGVGRYLYDKDSDRSAPAPREEVPPPTPEQLAEVKEILDEIGVAPVVALEKMGWASFEDIAPDAFEGFLRGLRNRLAKHRTEAAQAAIAEQEQMEEAVLELLS